MLRLATPGHLRLNQTPALEMTFGGGEANVAVSLALFGDEAAFITRLPKNDVAETCIQRLRGLGVDTRHILRGGERIGIYFLESGASQRASTVTSVSYTHLDVYKRQHRGRYWAIPPRPEHSKATHDFICRPFGRKKGMPQFAASDETGGRKASGGKAQYLSLIHI